MENLQRRRLGFMDFVLGAMVVAVYGAIIYGCVKFL